jgi:murein DD-endopeptidase MepM/ murein hydrolase activator NlpD
LSELVSRQTQLLEAQADRQALLASVHDERQTAEEDLEELEAASAELTERIRSAQGTYAGSVDVSSSGFIWPVNGPITSGFGIRWGRLHAGVDIGVGFGTAIHAAAAGTVIYAGWLGGYGNLVVIDHGNGLATAYAHQQQIYVFSGTVAQGQTIGEVGSTGNSTGPHLHFEVRVNGSPVDPLGYL